MNLTPNSVSEAGVTFWAEPETRVDSITTLILAVSALYIVILGNIPLVGYLTDFDRFVFWVSTGGLPCAVVGIF